ncbi:MAG: aminopeptidase P family protein [Betaproteobacteria bacterium]|nr:aminopeptidase P family protein [Betaproteobacteria bacterium]
MSTKTESASRLEKARALMRAQGVDCLIVTDALNFWYFTGQRIPLWMASRPAVLVLPQSGAPTVIDWSGPSMFARLYHKPKPNHVEDARIYPEIPIRKETPVDWGIAGLLEEKGALAGTVAIELGYETRLNLSIEDWELVKRQAPKVRWVDSGPITWACRMIKSEWEIEQLKSACQIGGKAWKKLFTELRPGMTTADIQRRALSYYSELGADMDSGAPTALGGTGPKGAFQKGDILYLDGACSVQGYRADFTRRVVFGPPSERQLSEHNGMWDILEKVMDFMKPGVATREVFEYSQGLMAKTKWVNYSSHPSLRIGHGIGLGVEPPYLNAFDQHILQPGMSITPEPKAEVHEGLLNPEEHIIMREGGVEIISTDPGHELLVIN